MGREQKYHAPLPVGFDEVLTAIAEEQRPDHTFIATKPFIKWVGGKRSILPELLRRMPKHYKAYHEPFMGGGALYFSVQPDTAYLADINFPLVITYNAVKNDVDTLIRKLKLHEKNHDKDYYLKMREKIATEKDPTTLASIFIYLNKTCYNGLYRVNKSGKFNVPMGNYKTPNILDEANLRNCSQLLQNAVIEQHTFSQDKIVKDDFYYLDPPYHETYDSYSNGGFGDEAHSKLAEYCKKIDQKGGFFMLSNSDTPFVRKLYKGYNIEKVSASRFVSCKAHQRGKEDELLIRNYK
jgi:DNA adenine methylase